MTARAKTNVNGTVERAQEQFEGTVFGGFDEAAVYGRKNLEAMIRASAIMSKGFEEMGRSWFSLTQGTVEQGVATWKALLGARNLREVVELQNEYARSTFDQWVNEGTKLSETALKVANEAWAPLNGRFSETVERATKPAA